MSGLTPGGLRQPGILDGAMPTFSRKQIVGGLAAGFSGAVLGIAASLRNPESARADGIAMVGIAVDPLPNTIYDTLDLRNQGTNCVAVDGRTLDTAGNPEYFFNDAALQPNGGFGDHTLPRAAEGHTVVIDYYACDDTSLSTIVDEHTFVLSPSYRYDPNAVVTTTTPPTTTEVTPPLTTTETTPPPTPTTTTTTPVVTPPLPAAVCTVPKLKSKHETVAQAKKQVIGDLECRPGSPVKVKASKAGGHWAVTGFAVSEKAAKAAHLSSKAKHVGNYVMATAGKNFSTHTILHPVQKRTA